MSAPRPPAPTDLARQVRERFVADLEPCLEALAVAAGQRLMELVDRSASSREASERRDAALEYDRLQADWVAAARRSWRRTPASAAPAPSTTGGSPLSLIDHDVVEKKIIASRLAMALQEQAGWELNDLKLRMQKLEGAELPPDDLLRPEGLALRLVDAWMDSGLPRRSWLAAGDAFQLHLGPAAKRAYQRANEHLVAHGVLPDIDLVRRVRRSADPASTRTGATGGGAGAGGSEGLGPGMSGGIPGAGPFTGPSGPSGRTGGAGGAGGAGGRPVVPASAGFGAGLSGAPGGGASMGAGGGADRGPGGGTSAGVPGVGLPTGPFATPSQVAASAWGRVPGDSHLGSEASPLGRVRARAQGVLVQLRRLLGERVSDYAPGQPVVTSAPLVEALAHHGSTLRIEAGGHSLADVHQVARLLREQSGELKRRAASPGEKALIEVVALMFQSILAEERIPPSVRVWFARLQMPVLRVALAEPGFFESLQHPARLLIDRMGACVLGFDATTIDGSEMESEIRRLVQMIEQYPETGRKVFALAYEEFQAFLARYLPGQGRAGRLVSVVQQVEQKDTLAVRYTIELRKMLDDMPVPEGIREFLFKVWAEVMAQAAVRQGMQHPETVALKKAAAELVWAAGAKPNRAERAQVIQGLPRLLQQLRQGMTLLGLPAPEQEAQIKRISDTLADAFQSRTAVIPTARVEAIAERLTSLESVAGGVGDLPLDADSLAALLGEDARDLAFITDGGTRPGAAAQAWARELQPGDWFTLDHNGQVEPVQYVWRSDMGHLHLFMARGGRCVLMQAGRLAAYLQAGLVVPGEDEALTVRATRDALAKLDANPERLLA